MGDLFLRNALLVTLDEAGNVFEGDLLIRDGSIAAMGEVPQEAREGAEVVELEGATVIPGFVQTHIHLCQTLMRHGADDMVLMDWLRKRIWPYEASLTADAMRVAARVGLAELLLGGTTTILDMGTVRHTDELGETLEASGVRAFFGKCMMDQGEGAPENLLEDTQESIRESLALYDRWNGVADGLLRYAFAPRFAVSCTEALLREVVAAAEERAACIHTHASETEFENGYSLQHHGLTNIAYLHRLGVAGPRTVLAHGVHVHDAECQLLAHAHCAIAHCPSSNLKLASGIANIPRYDEFGVQVSLGADGAPCNNNLDAFIEMRLAALLQKPIHGPQAMPAERVLRLATIDGARALGIDDQVGTLEVGKQADLIALSLDDDPGCGPGSDPYARIVYGARRHNVRHVFVRGRHLVRGGELLGEDLGSLMSQARGALTDVTRIMNA